MMKYILFIVLLICASNNADAQIIDKGIDPEQGRRYVELFRKFTDSLFLTEKYTSVIDTCNKIAESDYRYDASIFQLIPNLFFRGDTAVSDSILFSILDNEFKDYDNLEGGTSGIWLMNIESLSFCHYNANPYCRNKLINGIIERYGRGKMTKPTTGKQLVALTLNDQFIRKQALTKFDSIKNVIPDIEWGQQENSKFINDDSLNRKNVYDVYVAEKKLLSTKEVGTISYFQFLLFAHEPNLQRREYYFKLLEDGVKLKIADRSDLITFILRSESMKMGWKAFEKIKQRRIKELKKKYRVPHYVLKYI